MPSIHVAISVWILLVSREMAPRAVPYAACYVVFIWVASVALGWHYATDGLVGSLGMLGIWSISTRLQGYLDHRFGVCFPPKAAISRMSAFDPLRTLRGRCIVRPLVAWKVVLMRIERLLLSVLALASAAFSDPLPLQAKAKLAKSRRLML